MLATQWYFHRERHLFSFHSQSLITVATMPLGILKQSHETDNDTKATACPRVKTTSGAEVSSTALTSETVLHPLVGG